MVISGEISVLLPIASSVDSSDSYRIPLGAGQSYSVLVEFADGSILEGAEREVRPRCFVREYVRMTEIQHEIRACF